MGLGHRHDRIEWRQSVGLRLATAFQGSDRLTLQGAGEVAVQETAPGIGRPAHGESLLRRGSRSIAICDRIAWPIASSRLSWLGGPVPRVWVIAKSHLRRFWESRKDDSEIAQRDLLTWFKMAEVAD